MFFSVCDEGTWPFLKCIILFSVGMYYRYIKKKVFVVLFLTMRDGPLTDTNT